MAGTGQTLAMDIAPAPNLAQSYLDAGKIQAQQNDNAMAPLDLASKQLDLQQKQALAPLQVQAAKQKLVQQGLEMRATQTKAQQDAADRTMDRVGKAALAVSNASAEDRPGEWKSQLDGLLKTKTIDKSQYDTLVKQQPTDELLDHVIQGHRTYSEMLKTYDAQKTAAKKATLTPDQIANFTKDYLATIKDKPDATQRIQVFSQALGQTGDYAKSVDAADRFGPANALPASQNVTLDRLSAPSGFLPGPAPAAAAPAPTTAPAAIPPPLPSAGVSPTIGRPGVPSAAQAARVGQVFGDTVVPAAKQVAAPTAKNDKLGGNTEEQVLAHAREAIKADPRLAEPYKQRLKDLGIDPGKL